MPHPPRDLRGLGGDMRQFLGAGPLVDGGVGEEGGVVLADHHVDAERRRAVLGIEHPAHFARALAEGPGEPGDHPVAMPQRHQQRGEHIALLIDHPRDIALGVAAPLEPLVEIGVHRRDLVRQCRILDDVAVGIVDRELDQLLADLLGAADQDRFAIAEIAELDRRAQRHFLLGLGEHHPPRVGLGETVDIGQCSGGRVEPRLEPVGVFLEILDVLERHARIHRRLGDRARDHFDQPRIERRGDDVVAPELVVDAVSRGDFLGHPLARQPGDRLGGGDLHLLVDRGRLDIERAAEDEGEAEHVVDLVGIVAAPGGDDRIGADGLGLLGHDLGDRVGHREDDRLVGHLRDPFRLERPGGGEPEEDVRADQRLLEAARVGIDRMRALPLVHALLAAAIDRAVAIADDDVFVRHPHRLDQCGAGERRGAGAGDHHPAVLERAPGQFAGVDQPRDRDNRSAVLVVMHHRDLHPVAQRGLDDEAFGCLDVFQIDPAEGRLHQRDRVDEGLGILGGELDIDRIDIGEALEQYRLAFHHRLGRQRPEIAQPEDRGAIGDHRNQIGARGVFRRIGGVGGDRLDRIGDARRIGEAEVALGRHRLGGDDLDLTRADRLVVEQGLALGKTGLLLFGHLASPFACRAALTPDPIKR